MAKKQLIKQKTVSKQEKANLPALSTNADPLDREVAVAAALEERGVKIKAKSRAISAFDRLLGNIIDFPSALIEPKSNKMRDKGLLDRELNKIES